MWDFITEQMGTISILFRPHGKILMCMDLKYIAITQPENY